MLDRRDGSESASSAAPRRALSRSSSGARPGRPRGRHHPAAACGSPPCSTAAAGRPASAGSSATSCAGTGCSASPSAPSGCSRRSDLTVESRRLPEGQERLSMPGRLGDPALYEPPRAGGDRDGPVHRDRLLLLARGRRPRRRGPPLRHPRLARCLSFCCAPLRSAVLRSPAAGSARRRSRLPPTPRTPSRRRLGAPDGGGRLRPPPAVRRLAPLSRAPAGRSLAPSGVPCRKIRATLRKLRGWPRGTGQLAETCADLAGSGRPARSAASPRSAEPRAGRARRWAARPASPQPNPRPRPVPQDPRNSP